MKKELQDIIRYRIKQNPSFRAVFKPVMERKRNLVYKEYLHSEYPERLRIMKNRHKGERCFIIGNGPSLTSADLSKLEYEYTFAANRIFDIFEQTNWRPTTYLAVDKNFLADSYEEIYEYRMAQYFLEYNSIRKKPKRDDTIGFIRLPLFPVDLFDLHPYVSENLEYGFSEGTTVTYMSIQLALYMGFTEIYLLGVDFNYSVVRDLKGKIVRNKDTVDYFSGRPSPESYLNYTSSLRAYQAAKAYCDEHGILIKNATRGGKLEVFERVDFDQLVGG